MFITSLVSLCGFKQATDAVLCWKLVFYKGLREKEKKQLVSEVNVMRELRHPNIVRYHDRIVCRSKQCLYIVMEYCDAGDLAKQIEAAHKHHGGIDQDRIVLVVVQLIHALAYCHEGVGKRRCSRTLTAALRSFTAHSQTRVVRSVEATLCQNAFLRVPAWSSRLRFKPVWVNDRMPFQQVAVS